MSQEALTTSYQLYKQDTNYFLAWLDSTSQSCTPPPSTDAPKPLMKAPTSKQKSKARKDAAKAAKTPQIHLPSTRHSMTTKDILDQARLVAQCKRPIVVVPTYIQAILRRAIETRKQYSAWFGALAVSEKRDAEDEETENEGQEDWSVAGTHQHFIKVLEEAFKILTPRFDVKKIRVPIKNKGKGKAAALTTTVIKDESAQGLDFINRFEALGIEDIDEQAYEAMPTVTPTSGPVIIDISEPSPASILTEISFMASCYLSDMYSLRLWLREQWTCFAHGKLDLATVSLVTNVAIEIAYENEVLLLAQIEDKIPEHYHEHDIYNTLWMLAFNCCMADPKSGEGRLGYPSASFNPSNDLNPTTNSTATENEPSPAKEIVNWNTYVILNNYRASLHLDNEEEIWKIGGPTINKISSFTSKSYPGVKFHVPEIQETQICKSLMDLSIQHLLSRHFDAVHRARKAGWFPPQNPQEVEFYPLHDAIYQTMEKMWDAGQKGDEHHIRNSHVFTAQILYDMCDILNLDSENGTKLADPYLTLRQRASTAAAILDVKTDIKEGIFVCLTTDDEFMQEWKCDTASEHMLRMSHQISNVVMTNFYVGLKKSLLDYDIQGMRDKDEAKIYVDNDPAYYYNHNPIYCGLELLKLDLGLEMAGSDAANTWMAVASMAHIYNGMRQAKLLKEPWPLMDEAIEANIDLLFRGSLPSFQGGERQMTNRWALCSGAPATMFARERTMNSTFRVGWKVLITRSPISEFLEQYINDENDAQKLLFNLAQESKSGKKKPQGGLPNLLCNLRDTVEKHLKRQRIDLITLSRMCIKLIPLLDHEINAKAPEDRKTDPEDWDKFRCKEHPGGVLVYGLLDEIERKQIAKKCLAHPKRLDKSAQGRIADALAEESPLSVALEVIKTFLAEDQANPRPEVEPFDVVKTSAFRVNKTPNLKESGFSRRLFKEFGINKP